MNKSKFSVITLLSFDYAYLPSSIKSYYDFADEIIIGLDKNQISWRGNKFLIPDNFFKTLKEIDPLNKIKIAREDFYKYEDKPMQNQVFERNFLADVAKKDNWTVQIDADEIMLNPKTFFSFLEDKNPEKYSISASWISLFKELENSYLVVFERKRPKFESFPIATKARGAHVYGRVTEQEILFSPLVCLHFSWAKDKESIRQKLSNFGHAFDFDTDKYFKLWENASEKNYKKYKNFHPLTPNMWPRLAKIEKNPELFLPFVNYYESNYKKLNRKNKTNILGRIISKLQQKT